jgi:hypothetical protein
MTEITLKIKDETTFHCAVEVLRKATNLYEFFHETRWNENNPEMMDFYNVCEAIQELMFTDEYNNPIFLNERLELTEPVYPEDKIDDQDFMNWLIENDHIKFNDDGTVELPGPSEEFKEERKKFIVKYEKTQNELNKFIDSNFDEEQLKMIGILQ